MAKSLKAKAAKVAARPTEGKSFAFTGTLQWTSREEITAMIQDAGGTVDGVVTATLEYLVVGKTRGSGTSAAETKARGLNGKGASIQILDEAGLHDLLKPSAEEARALLKGKARGVAKWNEDYGAKKLYFDLDLSGEDFQKAHLAEAELGKLTLNHCDFRGANLKEARLGKLDDAQFGGADLTGATIDRASRCDFQKACLSGAYVSEAPGSCFDGADISSGSVRDLSNGSARGVQMTKSQSYGVVFTNADLTGANLADASCRYSEGSGARFDKADLSRVDFRDSKFPGASFCEAVLVNAGMPDVEAANADFTGAKLTGADLSGSKFAGANFTKADLRNVRAADTDFTGCTLDGADFTGAHLVGAKFDAGAEAAAIGIQQQSQQGAGAAGPAVAELSRIASQSQQLTISGHVDRPDGGHTILSVQISNQGGYIYCSERDVDAAGNTNWRHTPSPGKSLATFMQALANRSSHGALNFEKCEVKSSKAPVKPKELKAIALAAWCEVFGIERPTEEQLAERKVQKKSGDAEKREKALAELRGGKKGIKAWNERPETERRGMRFRNESFASLDLSNVNLQHVDLQGADFEGAKLTSAHLDVVDAKKASFQGISASGTSFAASKLADAAFVGAELTDCSFKLCSLLRTDFSRADLTKSKFFQADIRGANFTGAKMPEDPFQHTKFDEATLFPKGYELPESLVWAGTGHDPRLKKKVAEVKASGPLDLETFLKVVEENSDASRFEKVISMLKADRFQLFALTEDESVTGVVKSQSDPDLVYACRLDSAGEFTCCTQNLNVCGGLRGALCKHLLVLIIGLTKGERLDPTTVNAWMAASRLQKPKLDKEKMSEIFLKYKGAEAGEIDWRPMETVPEDFYAF